MADIDEIQIDTDQQRPEGTVGRGIRERQAAAHGSPRHAAHVLPSTTALSSSSFLQFCLANAWWMLVKTNCVKSDIKAEIVFPLAIDISIASAVDEQVRSIASCAFEVVLAHGFKRLGANGLNQLRAM